MCLLALAQAVETLRARALRGRQYRQLTPLWTAMSAAYPEVLLDHARADRFIRRVIECQDGLTKLAPHITVAAHGKQIGQCSTSELAAYIHRALALKREIENDELDLAARSWSSPVRSDIGDLVELSRALAEHRS